ncbi:MAG: TetR/AcrR family transcriptional regulator, partial [Candidatus Dormibacteraceae bacterium]
NVYYYFKTKDEIVGAILRTHADDLEAGLAMLERRHRSPRARLKALIGVLAGRRDLIARYGCPYGTLCSELTKRRDGSDPAAARLMQVPLTWAERQFRALGRRDADDLAIELVGSYQGSALLSSALGQPELMARQARRLERWIAALPGERSTPPLAETGKESRS